MSSILPPSTPRYDGLPNEHSPATMTAWDRMREAKMALMEQEENEARQRREKRRDRRESSVVASSSAARTDSLASGDSIPLSPHRVKPAPPSILRRTTSTASSFASLPASSSSSTSLDSYTALPRRVSRISSATSSTTSDFGPPSSVSDSSERVMRRRSSRVRFSDDHTGLDLSSENLSLSSMATSSPRKTSSVDALREDLARSTRLLSIDTRSSMLSVGSNDSDQFALSTSPLSRLSIPELEDGFQPQPLPYPKMSRRLSRLSAGSMTSAQDCTSESVVSAPPTPLRETLERSSLGSSPRRSVVISIAPSMRDSYGSIASTLLSTSGTSVSGLSSDNSSDYNLPKGGAYTSLLRSTSSSLLAHRIPSMNRALWHDVDLGLSPRSGPSPVVIQEATMPDSDQGFLQAHWGDGFISPLIMNHNPFENLAGPLSPKDEPRPRTIALDSVDMLPAGHAREDSSSSSMSSILHTKTHQRSNSSLSDVLSFPLPPSRHVLEVAITPIRERDAFITAEPVKEEPIEELLLGEDSGSGASEVCLDTPRPCSGISAFSSPPINVESPPSSPTLADMIMVSRTKPDWDRDAEKIVASPLLDAAVFSGILSPNSRLLKTASPVSSRPGEKRSSSSSQALRSGLSFTRGRGWSGSESEEEEFGKAIQTILSRRNSGRPSLSRSGSTSSTTSQSSRRSDTRLATRPVLRPMADRLSQLSNASTADSAGPLTPNDSDLSVPMSVKVQLPATPIRRSSSASNSSSSTIPGDFPWGGSAPSSPTGSIRAGKSGHNSPTRKSFYEDLNTTLQGVAKDKEKKRRMPKPTRKVEGWGQPEVLLEDAWRDSLQRQTLWNSSDEEMEWSKSQPSSSRGGTPDGKGKGRKSIRVASPDFGALGFAGMKMKMGNVGEFGSLLDEQMPEVGTAI